MFAHHCHEVGRSEAACKQSQLTYLLSDNAKIIDEAIDAVNALTFKII